MAAEQVYPSHRSKSEVSPTYFQAPETVRPRKSPSPENMGRAALAAGELADMSSRVPDPIFGESIHETPEQQAAAIHAERAAYEKSLRESADKLTAEARELRKKAAKQPSVAVNSFAAHVLDELEGRRVAMGDTEIVDLVDDRKDAIGINNSEIDTRTAGIEVARMHNPDGTQMVQITDNLIDLDHYRAVRVTARPDVYGDLDVVYVDGAREIPIVEPDQQAGYVQRIFGDISEIMPRISPQDDLQARSLARGKLKSQY